jgi:hypothetical protein
MQNQPLGQGSEAFQVVWQFVEHSPEWKNTVQGQ